MNDYIKPIFQLDKFTCPHCSMIVKHYWRTQPLITNTAPHNNHVILGTFVSDVLASALRQKEDEISFATCSSCGNYSVWLKKEIIFPITQGEPPSVDMPAQFLSDYNEARRIFSVSPKASCALLRLVLEKLIIFIGGDPKKKLYENIKYVIKEQDLSKRLEKMMDIIRIVGNNAVHPGKIDIDDNVDTALILFTFINLIVYEAITIPQKINNTTKYLKINP